MPHLSPTSAHHPPTPATTVATWILTIVVAALFLFSGTMKFVSRQMADDFARWGFPAGFQFLIGAIEIIGAVLLLFPVSASLGAGILGIIMIGAFCTHIWHAQYALAIVPLVVFILLGCIAYERQRE